jgi:two-component system, NtrC family, response regulator AtoC
VNFTILIVDDEEEICVSLSRIMTGKGFNCRYQTHALKVMEELRRNDIDLLIMDIRMPELSGIDLLRVIKKEISNLPVIIISGHASLHEAVEVMRYGILNFFTKPIKLQELIEEIDGVARLVDSGNRGNPGSRIITGNKQMKRLLKLVEKAAPTSAAVILTGESGTGKELVADMLHHTSLRKGLSYIKINCAAIPDSLIESELFGYEKGAFTDAKKRQLGKFELAGDGTIFLDEIGDMSLSAQAKILRVLQEHQFTRIGGVEPVYTNCRIIAATNKNLLVEIAEGRFREDLYYRLSVITLKLPSLKDRIDDISELSSYFLEMFNSYYGKKVKYISKDVKTLMTAYSWPGNIRELKNLIERGVIFSDNDTIEMSVIPDQYRSLTGVDLSIETKNSEYHTRARKIIMDALNRSGGSRQEASRILSISRKTLYNKMKKYNIQ